MLFAGNLGDPWYNNDEARHLMTAAFWRDFFVELPLADPAAFARAYYARYPALGIVHWPPLFHLILGAAFTLFGVSQFVAAALMTAFLTTALIGWHALAARHVGPRIAFASALALPLVPELFNLTTHTMLELPTLTFMILAVYFFDRFLRTDRTRPLAAAVFFAATAALTRPHSMIVLGPLLAQFLLARRWNLLRRPALWLLAAPAAALVGTYYAVTLRLISAWSSMLTHGDALGWGDLGAPLFSSLGPTLYALAALGIPWALLRAHRQPQSVLPLLAWIAATFLMFALIAYRPTRFLVYAWPAALTLGLAASSDLTARLNRPRLAPIVVTLILLGAATTLYQRRRPPLTGYEPAARRALAATDTRRILFHGRIDAAFIWHVRRLDPALSCTVFRASKILSAGEKDCFGDYRPLAQTDADMLAALDRLGVDVIVSEDRPEMNTPLYTRFLELLQTDRFVPLGEMPLAGAAGRIGARSLRLYRFRRNEPPADVVSLEMATLGPGAQLVVDLSRPLRHWNRRP